MGTDMQPVTELPERFAVLRSVSAGEAWPLAARMLTPFRGVQAGGAERLVSDVAVAELGPISLLSMRHRGGGVRLSLTAPVSYYDVNIVVAGDNRLDCGDSRAMLTPQRAGIISPRMKPTMQFSEEYTQVHLRIERFALERRLERMLGRPVVEPVRFQLAMDLTAPALSSWVRTVGLLVQDLEQPHGLSAHDGGVASWTEFLVSGLLRSQPHSYSAALRQREAGRALPARLRRAIDLVEEEPHADLSPSRLAAVAGVSTRSLQRDFRRHLSASPQQYVERIRLARSRSDLLEGASTTVADIAYRWGFGHLSRFAAAYRTLYGEAPSETLLAARRRAVDDR